MGLVFTCASFVQMEIALAVKGCHLKLGTGVDQRKDITMPLRSWI